MSTAPERSAPSLFEVRAVLLVALAFLPYAAIAIGNNTNVPLSSLVALTFLPVVLQHPRLAALLALVMLGPLAQNMALILFGQDASLAAGVAWALHVAPLVGFAGVALHRADALVTPLYWSLIGSCAYAFVQLTFIRRGTIPFINLYELPGYASVKNQEVTILTYIRRPFGLFPEPSFLAGTLALGTVLYLVLRARESRPLAGRDFGLVLVVSGTIFLTQSGSGVLTIGTVLLLAILPYRNSRWVPFALLGAVVLAVRVALEILTTRNSGGQNFSWGDRVGSLLAAGQYVRDSSVGWLVGLGKGSLSELFLSGQISVGTQGGRLLDTASVVLRLIFELGLPLGLLVVGSLAVAIISACRDAVGGLGAMLVLATWLIVAGATITYDSAALIWAIPGVAFGLVYQRATAAGRILEQSTR